MRNIDNLDLNLLRSLRALLQEKHVGRAASRLNVVQSTTSHSLRKLREFFEDPLLVRVGNEMELTPRAKQLSANLTVIFDELFLVGNSGEFRPEDLQRTIRIDTNEHCVRTFVARAVRHIQSIAPKLKFNIHTCCPDSLQDLLSGRSDLVIAGDICMHPRLKSHVLHEEPKFCLLEGNHPALKNWCVEEVFKYPHVCARRPQNAKQNLVDAFAFKHNFTRQISLTTDNTVLQTSFVHKTDKIAFVPKSLAVLVAKSSSLIAMPSPIDVQSPNCALIWHEINQSDPGHEWVREMIAKVSMQSEDITDFHS